MADPGYFVSLHDYNAMGSRISTRVGSRYIYYRHEMVVALGRTPEAKEPIPLSVWWAGTMPTEHKIALLYAVKPFRPDLAISLSRSAEMRARGYIAKMESTVAFDALGSTFLDQVQLDAHLAVSGAKASADWASDSGGNLFDVVAAVTHGCYEAEYAALYAACAMGFPAQEAYNAARSERVAQGLDLKRLFLGVEEEVSRG